MPLPSKNNPIYAEGDMIPGLRFGKGVPTEKGYVPDPSYLLPPERFIWEKSMMGTNSPLARMKPTERARTPDFELPLRKGSTEDLMKLALQNMDIQEIMDMFTRSYADNPVYNERFGLDLPTRPEDIIQQDLQRRLRIPPTGRQIQI